VVLTGASSGFGEHWARTACLAGASALALVARREDRLRALASALSREFPRTKVVHAACDVSDAGAIVRALDELEAALGEAGATFDVIVNNAGIGPSELVLNAKLATFDEVMSVNVRGPYVLAHEAATRLVKRGKPGSIINVASIYGVRVGEHHAHYATSKAALVQLTKAMAIELLKHNVRVNALAPGYFRTELTADFFDSDAGKKFVQSRIPARRLGHLEELDGAFLLLASDASKFMTGTVVVVDGGHLSSSL